MKLSEILQRTLEIASAVGTPYDVGSGRAASMRLCFQINSALVTSTPWRKKVETRVKAATLDRHFCAIPRET